MHCHAKYWIVEGADRGCRSYNKLLEIYGNIRTIQSYRNKSWPHPQIDIYIYISIDSRCFLQIGDESPDICICFLSSPLPPHIYVSKCVYVYVHISLFLPECACTTIIDISPRIFKLIYCCCVSIIIVICLCPPGALIWLINLFYSILFYSILY